MQKQEELLKEARKQANRFEMYLSPLKAAYEGLNIGPFSHEAFTEIVESGTASAVAKYRAKIDQELDQEGLKSSFLKNMVISGSQEPVLLFTKAYDNLNEYNTNLPKNSLVDLSLITFQFGEFVLTEKDELKVIEAEKKRQKFLDLHTETLDRMFLKHVFNEADFTSLNGTKIKELIVGLGSIIITKKGRDYNISFCNIRFTPSDKPYYVYAKCLKGSKEGAFLLSREEMTDTETHHLILIQSGMYEDIKF